MALYTYCLRFDDGAAPNPYWGVCTLTICKPAIRRTAKIGDWVVGHGSRRSPCGDISHSIVYAMQVSDVKSLEDYDRHCRTRLKGKIPDSEHRDFRRRVGDCVYDYSSGEMPRLRPGVHVASDRKRDLSGKNALLSDFFFYFGDAPVDLPRRFHPILHPMRGHKKQENDRYLRAFEKWILGLGYAPNTPHGDPQLKPRTDDQGACRSPSGCSDTPKKKRGRQRLC